MQLTAEQIQQNWDKFIDYTEKFIKSRRKENLINFYKKYEDRLILMPASHKKEYHSATPGGYIYHVVNVVENTILLYDVWKRRGADTSTFSYEEMIFSALNHDLGKLGDENEDSYIPQTDQWRKDKLGEDYMFNTKLPFASVPDRGLFLLQAHDIKYSFNEMIAIQTHDGLYDEGNKKYLISFMPEQKPRTSLPYIIHQADLMAARIEFEQEWLPIFNSDKPNKVEKPAFSLKQSPKTNSQQKALGSIKNENLKNFLDKL